MTDSNEPFLCSSNIYFSNSVVLVLSKCCCHAVFFRLKVCVFATQHGVSFPSLLLN